MNGLSDILGGAFDPRSPDEKLRETNARLAEQRRLREQEARDKTPVPPMRGRTVDGVKYLRAEDVLKALDATGSAVRVAAKVRKWLG